MPQAEFRVPEEPVCPAARKVVGATDADGGVVCGIKERDAERADPILEGSPTGIVVRWGEDPGTLLNFCCGQGEPLPDPDDLERRAFGQGHYTGCPIWAAGKDIDLVERAFALERVQPSAVPGVSVPGLDLSSEILETAGTDLGER